MNDNYLKDLSSSCVENEKVGSKRKKNKTVARSIQ